MKTEEIIKTTYFKKVLELIKSAIPEIIYPNEPESLAVKICQLVSPVPDLESAKEEVKSAEEIPLILNEEEQQELKCLRAYKEGSNNFMSSDRYDRLQELLKREFGFNMGPENKYGNLFLLPDGKVVQGGLNASQFQSVQSKENTANKEGLLPCPFCGNYPEWVNKTNPDGHYYLRCHTCQFTISDDRRDKVFGQWNQRIIQPVQSVKGEGERTAKEILSKVTGLSIEYMFGIKKDIWSITPDKIIEVMESYKHSESKEQWISVEDRLPEKMERVLCYNGFRVIEQSWCSYTNHDIDWFKKEFTHWMPLPEPPKSK